MPIETVVVVLDLSTVTGQGYMAEILNTLVVGCDPDDIDLINSHLGEHECTEVRIRHSRTINEACGVLDICRFDLILLDMDIPGIDGMDALGRIAGSTRDVPVVLITSRESEAEALDAMRNGAQDYILRDCINGPALRNCIRYATEKKNIEKELVEARRVKSKFISMISHELRTPLTAVKESVRILSDEKSCGLDEEQADLVDLAKRNIEKLEKIVSDILDFQKIENGEMTLEKTTGDIRIPLGEICSSLEPVARDKGLGFRMDIGGDVPEFQFDREKIARVIYNLVNNALKFTDKGWIAVALSSSHNTVVVNVSDSGPGIDESDLARIFRQFEQVENLNDRKGGGTGLGLAISREIVERHGGRIWVESSPGKGSTFSFLLPIVERRSR